VSFQGVTTPPLSVMGTISNSGQARAFTINETATCDALEVTLLTLVVVDKIIRVSGLIQIRGRVDVALCNVPTLSLSPLDGTPLRPVGSHLLPHGQAAVWVSWVYQRPAHIFDTYEARIDRIDVANRRGRHPPEAVAGPWVFAFRMPTSGPPLRLISG